jgi:hypothetical protein
MSRLVWQPIHVVIDERARSGDRLFWIVAPFVKLDALARLFDSTKPTTGLKLVCRWRPEDLVAGVSDLEVFGYLKAMGCELYVNQQIHMKLYAFESNVAISTSANLTLRGMGYVDIDRANIEVGSDVELTAADWVNLYRVVRGSRLMTPELYTRFVEYVNANPPRPQTAEAPDLLGPPKKFTLASLPATDSPEELAEFYFHAVSSSKTAEDARKAFQDLATFGVPPGLSRTEFDNELGNAFRESPFVVEFVDHLRVEGSLHFGAVNTWIHQKCEDVPLPYRWEVKTNTHAFYNWLSHFFPEVTWDRPHYSQVIYWGRGSHGEKSVDL